MLYYLYNLYFMIGKGEGPIYTGTISKREMISPEPFEFDNNDPDFLK